MTCPWKNPKSLLNVLPMSIPSSVTHVLAPCREEPKSAQCRLIPLSCWFDKTLKLTGNVTSSKQLFKKAALNGKP